MDILGLSEFFKTKAESINFLTRIRTISEKIYTNDFNLEKLLLNEIGLEKKDKFLSLLINNKVNTSSKTDLSNFFTKILERIATLPTITIFLAFEPDVKTMEILSEWFMLNTKKQFLFDFIINPQLVAGAEILTNGKHSNSSIRAKFDQIIKDELLNYKTTIQNSNKISGTSNEKNTQNQSQVSIKS